MSLETQKEKGCTVIRLFSGERICADDKYLISRHDGSGFYKDDLGRLTKCGTFPDYDARPFPLEKEVLKTKVTAHHISGTTYKVEINIPRYEGKLHWLEFTPQGAKSLFDCINEDKVFVLLQAKTPAFMAKMHHIVGQAICYRYGLE